MRRSDRANGPTASNDPNSWRAMVRPMTRKNPDDPIRLITTSTDRLSGAVDRILARLPPGLGRPSKLTLLNDLAQAIRPGANWGGIKAAAGRTQVTSPASAGADLTETPSGSAQPARLPPPATGARTLPARLFQVRVGRTDRPDLQDLIDDVQSLFGLRHRDLPIVGLDLEVFEGNGDTEASLFANLLVLDNERLACCRDHALDMDPAVARLVFGAVQNLQGAQLYSVLGQFGGGSMRIVLGPCRAAAALPSASYHASRQTASQGVRILVPEGCPPNADDLEVVVNLVGAALPALELPGYGPMDGAVRLILSMPRRIAWSRVDLRVPEKLPVGDVLTWSKRHGWIRDEFRMLAAGKLDEALDLALAVLDIDDPDVCLHATLGPERPRPKRGPLRPGWRGDLARNWRVLRLDPERGAELLQLDPIAEDMLQRGLNGWAEHEGYRIVDTAAPKSLEILVGRDSRRAAHHLDEVQAIMEAGPGVDALLGVQE